MARRSYLQRIAEPLRAGDPVLFALPRAPAAEARAAPEFLARRAAAPANPPAPRRRTTPPPAQVPDVEPSDEMPGPSRAPAAAAAAATTPASRERMVIADAPPPPPFAVPVPREPTPDHHDADPLPATAPRATFDATTPQIPAASIAVMRPPSGHGPDAPPRIHIGAVEVRSAPPPPPPVPRPAALVTRRADMAPIARGYAWPFGLIQG